MRARAALALAPDDKQARPSTPGPRSLCPMPPSTAFWRGTGIDESGARQIPCKWAQKSSPVDGLLGVSWESRRSSALNGPQGDDRNRTGVDGFAVSPNGLLSAYLSGFRRPQVLSDAPPKNARLGSWGEPATHAAHRALNLIRPCHVRTPASRSSVLCGFADASDASDKMTCVRDVSRDRLRTRDELPRRRTRRMAGARSLVARAGSSRLARAFRPSSTRRATDSGGHPAVQTTGR
jgi:hypothetical protein